MHFWGRDLVIFRGQDGRVGVLDAYCPHLGAHLYVAVPLIVVVCITLTRAHCVSGIGGKVAGNCIQCPFHGWSFDRDGQCKSIPYSDGDIPANAHTKSFVIDETHRVILMWFDAEGRAPTWRLQDAWPQIPDEYNYVGKAVHHVGCHISEVPENGADVAHLNILHEAVHPVVQWLTKIFTIKHKVSRARACVCVCLCVVVCVCVSMWLTRAMHISGPFHGSHQRKTAPSLRWR